MSFQWISIWHPNTRICFFFFFFCLWSFPWCWNPLFPPLCQIRTTWEITAPRSSPQPPTISLGWHISETYINSPQWENELPGVVLFLVSTLHCLLPVTLYHRPTPSVVFPSLPKQFSLKTLFPGLHLKQAKLKQNQIISQLSGDYQPMPARWISLVDTHIV